MAAFDDLGLAAGGQMRYNYGIGRKNCKEEGIHMFRKKKILFCILAVLSAATLLSGCSREKEDDGQRRDDRDDVESGEELTSNIGIIEGNAYANLLMGFGCVVEEGWTFSSREEIAELCGITVDILDEAELSGAIDAGMYDMVAVSADGMANVNVVIQNTGLLGSAVEEEDVVEQVLGQMGQLFGSMGYEDVKTEAQAIDFVDGEHAGIYTSATINNIDFYQCQVTYKVGTHIASVTASSYGEDVTKDILAWFDKAENAIPDPGILGR